MDNNTTKVIIYTKTVRTKEGKYFPKTLLKVGNTTMEAIFSGSCKKELEAQKLETGIHFPIELELKEEDYFIKEKNIKLEDGNIYNQRTCVILNYQSLSQGEFSKQLSFRDLTK